MKEKGKGPRLVCELVDTSCAAGREAEKRVVRTWKEEKREFKDPERNAPRGKTTDCPTARFNDQIGSKRKGIDRASCIKYESHCLPWPRRLPVDCRSGRTGPYGMSEPECP